MKKQWKVIFLGLLVLFLVLTSCNTSSSDLVQQLGYSRDDILLIVNADDVGMHEDITDGIYETMKTGICKSASIMVPCPDFNRAISIWKRHPEFELGIHLTLTINGEYSRSMKYPWKPILSQDQVPSLYSPDGYMWHDIESLLQNVKVPEALQEIEAQINKFQKTGLKPTHLNGHMAFYIYNSDLYEGLLELSEKYNIPLRPKKDKIPILPSVKKKFMKKGLVFPHSVTFFYKIKGETSTPDIRKQKYYEYLQSLKPGIYELGIHPGYVKSEILEEFLDNPTILRNDFRIWTSQETRKLIKTLNIRIIGYSALQNLQIKNTDKN